MTHFEKFIDSIWAMPYSKLKATFKSEFLCSEEEFCLHRNDILQSLEDWCRDMYEAYGTIAVVNEERRNLTYINYLIPVEGRKRLLTNLFKANFDEIKVSFKQKKLALDPTGFPYKFYKESSLFGKGELYYAAYKEDMAYVSIDVDTYAQWLYVSIPYTTHRVFRQKFFVYCEIDNLSLLEDTYNLSQFASRLLKAGDKYVIQGLTNQTHLSAYGYREGTSFFSGRKHMLTSYIDDIYLPRMRVHKILNHSFVVNTIDHYINCTIRGEKVGVFRNFSKHVTPYQGTLVDIYGFYTENDKDHIRIYDKARKPVYEHKL